MFSENKQVLLVKQDQAKTSLKAVEEIDTLSENNYQLPNEIDAIVHQSCLDYLTQLKKQYPAGVFDLAFADPPYNLAKNYSKYQDDLDERKYIEWCNDWLDGMYKNLKPGGSLFVLNIPKWAIYHFNYLADKMIFRNWIVWDALSTPAGKLLPAHYSLLYFTKPGAQPRLNLVAERYIDLRVYCIRNQCIVKRKKAGADKKELVTDIWRDIHRIKHKKDRDHHPCQLPTKLMERIIKTFSREGDLIFDPFGGAGTTAISAKVLNRHFILTELDIKYVEVARRNLSKIQLDIFGGLFYNRVSVNKPKIIGLPRKRIENAYMSLCISSRKIYTMDDLKVLSPETYDLVKQYQGSFKKLQSATKRKMDAQSLLSE